MPFDPDKFLAQSAFDPDAFLAEASPSAGKKLEAGIEGFGDAASLGYLPQLGAALGGLIEPHGFLENPSDKQNRELEAQGFSVTEQKPNYVERRDALIQRQKGLQQDAPEAYGAGSVGGAIASAPVLSKAIGGGLLKSGAIAGGLANPGDREGAIDPLQLGDRVLPAATGAAIGGGLGLLGKGVEKFGGAIQPEALKGFETTKLLDALGIDDHMRGTGAASAGALLGGVAGGDIESALKGAAVGSALKLGNKAARTYLAPALDDVVHGAGGLMGKVPQGLLESPQLLGGALQSPEAAILLNRMVNKK